MRTIKWVDRLGNNIGDIGSFRISDKGVDDFYTISRLKTDFGRGFRVFKVDSESSKYNVLLDKNCECDCPGFTYYGKCRHVSGLIALGL